MGAKKETKQWWKWQWRRLCRVVICIISIRNRTSNHMQNVIAYQRKTSNRNRTTPQSTRTRTNSINQSANQFCIASIVVYFAVCWWYWHLYHFCVSLSFALVSSRRLGASRGFAFVEFNTEEEATHWISLKQVSGVKQSKKRTKPARASAHVQSNSQKEWPNQDKRKSEFSIIKRHTHSTTTTEMKLKHKDRITKLFALYSAKE